MDLVTKALRAGEGRKFKTYQKRAEAINRFEPEMEALSDAELRADAPAAASRSKTCCRRLLR
jgi:preprotein translocase subunit SecA